MTLWTVAGQTPLSMGFSRQEYWSGLPCPPPGDLPDPGIKPVSLRSPALAGGCFTTSATWETLCTLNIIFHIPLEIAPAGGRQESVGPDHLKLQIHESRLGPTCISSYLCGLDSGENDQVYPRQGAMRGGRPHPQPPPLLCSPPFTTSDCPGRWPCCCCCC